MSYYPGSPAKGPAFVGRQMLLGQLDSSPSWLWICGPRRMGKTSLLFRLEEMARQRGDLCLMFDLLVLAGQALTPRRLFDGFFRTHRSRVFQPRGLSLDSFDAGDAAQAFSECLGRLLESQATGTVHLFWDEAEMLLPLPPEFLASFVAQLRQFDRLRLVVAASQAFGGIYSKAPDFLNAFHWIPLAGLDESASDAVLCRSRTGGWLYPLSETASREAGIWCGGHPFLLQNLGVLLAESTGNDGRRVSQAVIQDCQTRLVHNPNIRNTIADDFNKLTPLQQELLQALCQSSGATPIASLVERVAAPSDRVDDANGFLRNYGYVRGRDPVQLQYEFYRSLVPVAQEWRPTPQTSVDRIRRTIFVSYSQRDAPYREMLRTALRPILREEQDSLWDDQCLVPGERWSDEIEGALNRARMAILLVSQNFLASEFITRREVPELLASAVRGGCRLLCLHVSSNTWDLRTWSIGGTPTALSEFQALNDPRRPLDALSEAERQAALATTARQIHQLLYGG